jgi:4-amino-4-deoxy-L-arabinose transferase-like glycosyltransferase
MDNSERTTTPLLGGGDEDDADDLLTFFILRLLVSPSSEAPESAKQNRNTIIYIIYLTVLGMCCLSPCFYYLRFWSWQRRRLRRMWELEHAGVAVAMARSSGTAVADDGDAIQEERKARISQLMKPVRMVSVF